ncbi:4a-hydroxytetrahydrobiopterin dehydratase [Oscillatoria sp. FACHB-1407]|uniref:4a-hydroxytetrahydrobiopterin dehydratase n=1 Tax=Oscillatoria sp. FACHB-1407 TaxID=2692847 RepID=UPI0018F0425F|nr:4a-hydroxytetrahydrobiopterin dehydratase [Oscillatoria sp. FACHB-1407]
MLLSGAEAVANPNLVRLTQVEVTQQLRQLPGWETDGQRLYRTYRFANFVEAIAFVNRLVAPAEAAAHHPDLTISYNVVTVSLTTHDAGGLTQQDFDLARQISAL